MDELDPDEISRAEFWVKQLPTLPHDVGMFLEFPDYETELDLRICQPGINSSLEEYRQTIMARGVVLSRHGYEIRLVPVSAHSYYEWLEQQSLTASIVTLTLYVGAISRPHHRFFKE